MNIKVKLSFQFSLIVAAVLIVFSGFVYYFSYSSYVTKFRENLLESAKNTAILLIDVVEVDSTLLKKIQKSTILLDQEEVAITDASFKQIYSNNTRYLTQNLLSENYSDRDVSYFSYAEKEGVYYRHKINNGTYHVYVMAYDQSRRENLSELKGILIWSISISILLSILLSYLFSKNAIKPIKKINASIKTITSSKLSSRLDEGKNNDEIDQLARTFNEMLAKLDVAFKNQEDFISNASHELRTPLTVMIAESDFLLNQEKTKEEYKEHVINLVRDLKIINSQINSLLELAQLNSESRIQLSSLHIDELVFNSIKHIKAKYPERKIIPQIQYPEDDNELLVKGNAALLEIAFNNLIENACKFSAEDVAVAFLISTEHIKIIITDKGIGIPSNEMGSIYYTFSRASNAKSKTGFGLGLSLVAKILELHEVAYSIHSIENEGTQFEVLFKRQFI